MFLYIALYYYYLFNKKISPNNQQLFFIFYKLYNVMFYILKLYYNVK